MNILKYFATASLVVFSITVVAAETAVLDTVKVESQSGSFVSAENVITQDDKVIKIHQFLQRQKFAQISTVTNPTYYIVAPAEESYQTAEAVITMAAPATGGTTEYADVHVAIIYDSATDTYSAGEVSVKKYVTTRKRL